MVDLFSQPLRCDYRCLFSTFFTTRKKKKIYLKRESSSVTETLILRLE